MEVPHLSQSKRFKDCPQYIEALHKILYELIFGKYIMLEAIVSS